MNTLVAICILLGLCGMGFGLGRALARPMTDRWVRPFFSGLILSLVGMALHHAVVIIRNHP